MMVTEFLERTHVHFVFVQITHDVLANRLDYDDQEELFEFSEILEPMMETFCDELNRESLKRDGVAPYQIYARSGFLYIDDGD